MLLLAASRVCQRRPARLVSCLIACAGLLACRAPAESRSEKSSSEKPAAGLAPEAERLQFALPAEFVAVSLRGEGSEALRAPPGATVRTATPGQVEVEAGAEFALEVELQSQLAQLPGAIPGARPVVRESDVVVFEAGGGYWFMTLRELVPEWDESDRRRVVCSSAGAARNGPGVEPRRFPRAAVERMVAACRSLELPRLD